MRRGWRRRLGAALVALGAAGPPAARAAAAEVPASDPASAEVVVTGRARSGADLAASAGSVDAQTLEARPILRAAEALEVVPGLAVTIHSGEGKANQYLLRGFNLDHGTDFAVSVDGMPVNRPTNVHGQGYADLNFLLPELIGRVDYAKGPYSAASGDFSAVGSARLALRDALPATLSASAGSFGAARLFLGGSTPVPGGLVLLGAAELARADGPFDPPEDFRKANAVLRLSGGGEDLGGSLTAMYLKDRGRLSTDQPQRAQAAGLIGRYGLLDPTDANLSERASLSGRGAATLGVLRLTADLYAVRSRMTLWNDFTHFLDDPVNGDQEQQTEARWTGGGRLAATGGLRLAGVRAELTVGVEAREDFAAVSRLHTRARVPLTYCETPGAAGAAPVPAPGGRCEDDHVRLQDLGPYLEASLRWTPWLRTVLGLREEIYGARDRERLGGVLARGREDLLQPKGAVILGPVLATELYVSAGRGFHSDDVRGVLDRGSILGVPAGAGATPLLARADGEEVGARLRPLPGLRLDLALFQEDFSSELAYDADIGQNSASAPSRRRGAEIDLRWEPRPWLAFALSMAAAHARYRGELAAFGLNGPYIANAPRTTGSASVELRDLAGWSGELLVRELGPYPLLDGDPLPRDPGYVEVDLAVVRQLSRRLSLRLEGFNILGARADASAYAYVSRLPGEPAEGVLDRQIHPLEPASARATVTFSW